MFYISFNFDIQVTDSKGHILLNREDTDQGKFAFTTEEYDMFEICIETKMQRGAVGGVDREIFLSMKHGIEAKSYEEVSSSPLS